MMPLFSIVAYTLAAVCGVVGAAVFMNWLTLIDKSGVESIVFMQSGALLGGAITLWGAGLIVGRLTDISRSLNSPEKLGAAVKLTASSDDETLVNKNKSPINMTETGDQFLDGER